MLLVTDEEVRQALPMRQALPPAIDAIEAATRAQGEGLASVHKRVHLDYPPGSGMERAMRMLSAIVPNVGAGLRVYSVSRLAGNGATPRVRPHGLKILFDFTTMSMLAMFEDDHLHVIRTAAPTGVAVRHLALPDVREVAIIGSGKHARGQLAAVCAVRPISRARVYSRTPEHREQYAREMSELLSVEVTPCESAEEAVDGAGVVVTATNATEPVIERGWLDPGTLVTSIATKEIDAATILDSHLITSSIEQTLHDEPPRQPFAKLLAEGCLGPEDFTEISHVLAGRAPGRASTSEIITYISVGCGLWDPVTAALAERRVRELGLGHEWPPVT